MVPKSKNLDFGFEIKDSWCFLDFWDSDFPNSFRKNRSPMAPQGKPLCGKESHMDPLHVRFSSQTVESICFYQSNSTFSWKPCFLRSSVWGQFRQVFVCPPTLRGSCWIFDYWIFQHDPPGDGGGGGGEVETKSPRGSRPSPAPAPRNKIIPFGGPSLRLRWNFPTVFGALFS